MYLLTKNIQIIQVEFEMKYCLFFLLFTLNLNLVFSQPSKSKSKDLSKFSLNDVFQEVVKNPKPPVILDTIETKEIEKGIEVMKIHFQSVIDENRTNLIFAYIIRQKSKNKLPAMLILHGGTQSADDYLQLGISFSKRGYACLIPDLPGISSPENSFRNGKGSSGKWTEFAYGAKHFEVNPDITNCVIYEGVVAAIQAFYLLKNQPYVNSKAIGVRGLSWGGYASVMTTALLGKQVKAGLAVYGSGYYDLPSYFQSILNNMDTISRNKWLSSLDAGRYSHRIKAPFLFMAASNDTYFHPPAVMATFEQIKGTKNILFAPNNDHNLSNLANADFTELAWFDYFLQNKGAGIPKIEVVSIQNSTDSTQVIVFRVKGKKTDATVWYTSDEADWMKKTWIPVSAFQIKDNNYQVVLPKETIPKTGYWYMVATNENQVSNGTKIYQRTKIQ